VDTKEQPQVVKRTCYDGDQFGELQQFRKNIEEFDSEKKTGSSLMEI
jgi:hypothetical protein